MKSIIQSEKRCLICGTTYKIERHHCLHGTANRKLAEEHGLTVWLCPYHHRDNEHGVHGNKSMDLMLKQLAQRTFEQSHTRDEFVSIFGRNYL